MGAATGVRVVQECSTRSWALSRGLLCRCVCGEAATKAGLAQPPPPRARPQGASRQGRRAARPTSTSGRESGCRAAVPELQGHLGWLLCLCVHTSAQGARACGVHECMCTHNMRVQLSRGPCGGVHTAGEGSCGGHACAAVPGAVRRCVHRSLGQGSPSTSVLQSQKLRHGQTSDLAEVSVGEALPITAEGGRRL